MPDITMCHGGECHLKERCRRFISKPGEYQSYFIMPPIEDGYCEYYWRTEIENHDSK